VAKVSGGMHRKGKDTRKEINLLEPTRLPDKAPGWKWKVE
jgi:hypothetical protein